MERIAMPYRVFTLAWTADFQYNKEAAFPRRLLKGLI